MTTTAKLRERLRQPPPGPFRPDLWKSPLRGPWLTSFLGSLLGPIITVQLLTGLVSHWAYRPDLGGRNPTSPPGSDIPVLFTFPTSWPSWDYAVTQGVHVTLGLMTIPIVLAKLWSVIPKLFTFPPARTPAQALERLSILLLVSSTLMEFVTGTLDVEYWYPWGFDYYTIHYYGAWIVAGSVALHTLIKLPTVRRAYRERGLFTPLSQTLAQTVPEPPDEHGLVAADPDAPTISRRGLLGAVGAGSAAIFVLQAGQVIGGPLRRVSLLAARGRVYGTGPNDFPITTTARSGAITERMIDADWRLTLSSPGHSVTLSRAELEALPQHAADLTITCVEGWATTQHWSGVRLADLRSLARASADAQVLVSSFQPSGPFRHIRLGSDQVAAGDAILALHVNGVAISADHGYPARVIVPGVPGVHNTKWVATMEWAA